MSFHIFATVDHGTPDLVIRNAITGRTVLRWRGCNASADSETRRLFRELILLSCCQEMSNARVFSVATRESPG